MQDFLCVLFASKRNAQHFPETGPNKLKQWIPSPHCDQMAFDPREVKGQLILPTMSVSKLNIYK
jgi:hypothetical protein